MREDRSNTISLRGRSVRRLAMGMALVLGLFLVPGLSQALGLGDIEVRSALNQPLDAEIELIAVRPGEMEDLQVRLAPEGLYQRLGIARTGLLTQLRFQPETLPDGRHVVRVTTREAVREPFVNFLIEASWPAGRLVREYTMLLDPPVMFEAREAPAPVPAPTREARPAEPRPAPAPRAEPPRRAAPDGYHVQRGDTLWNVASDLRPSQDVSIEQMMLALLRANPEAFTDDNINNLRSGYVLRVPDQTEVNRLTRAEATREVARQNALWQEYRTRVAQDTRPQVPAPPAPAMPPPAVAEPAVDPATADDARLEILAAREAQEAVADMERELGLAREAAEARGREADDLRSRVAELEELLERRERLLELTNEQMAELQARLDQVEGREPVVPEVAPEPAPELPEETPAIIESEAERMAAAPAPEVPEPPVAAEPAPEPPAATATPAPVEPPRQASMIDDLLANPNALMMVGGVILLILLLVWLMVRRGRGSRAEDAGLAVATPGGGALRLDSGAAGALAGAAAGAAGAGILTASRDESEETHAEGEAPAETVAEAGFEAEAEAEAGAGAEAPAIVSEEHAEITNDDTIAEVDVYLAYGLYGQAEDLLNKAVEEHPERVDYRFKLAETHYATRNAEAFDANAERMNEVLAGRPSQLWERVQSMGQDLNPGNPLYFGAVSMALAGSGMGSEVDLDLGMEDLEGSLEDVDLEEDLEQPEVTDEHPVTEPEEMVDEEADKGPAAATDEALEFDLGELELDADNLDVDLLGEEVAGEAATEDLTEAREDDTRLEETDLEVPETAGFELDDTLMEETEPAERPTGAGIAEDDTQILEEDFADVDFLGSEETEDELLMSEDESTELPSGDEVSTKLDLARAYIDMGDSEGARSTLEEVLTEGNDSQKREAQSLIDQLS
jgi:pilus assembly protein FimV